ncbi:hypothetical protein F5884DRAFT_758949 [Xylogone sp. PMI_703]|nr:hypothetical protein F5884DRAFT_758949 [Xylogone sp. PMI_703]
MGANAWEIAIGTEPRPQAPQALTGRRIQQEDRDQWQAEFQRAQDAQRDWDKRAGSAIMILNNSVNDRLQEAIEVMVQEKNVAGIWTELANHNRSADLIYQDDLSAAFGKETWNPKNETLSAFIDKLNSYRVKLSGTHKAISEDQLLAGTSV